MKGIPRGCAGIYNQVTWNDSVLLDLYQHVCSELLTQCNQGWVLDVGMGPGRLLLEIAGLSDGFEVVGVDVSLGMVKIARKHINKSGLSPRACVLAGDAVCLPFDDNTFDIIISTMTIPFWKEPIKVLEEMSRALKKKGDAWVYDLNRDASAEAEQVFRSTYGWAPALKYLRMMRTSYTLDYDKARRLILAPGIGFTQAKIQEWGVFLQLRLIK